MPYSYRVAALGGLLATACAGCNLLDSGGGGISEQVLLELRRGLGCNVEGVEVGDTREGELGDECELEDNSFVDYYAFLIGGDDERVRVELESADFTPVLTLADRDGDLVGEDVNGDGDDRAEVVESLGQGQVYIVAVRTVSVGETGNYTLRVEAEN